MTRQIIGTGTIHVDESALTGKLREGAVERVLEGPGHVAGARIRIKRITVEYELIEERPAWGLSGNVRITPPATP